MSRQLWLLRHGDAEPHGTRADAQRRLTPRGEEQGTVAGLALNVLDIDIARAFTSPKVRALETAVLACASLGVEVTQHDALASGFDSSEALALLRVVNDSERLLVVGHEPDFSQVVHDLTGARVDFKKGAIAGVRMDTSTSGELIVLLRPRELVAIAGRYGA